MNEKKPVDSYNPKVHIASQKLELKMTTGVVVILRLGLMYLLNSQVLQPW